MRNDGDENCWLDEAGSLKPCPDTCGLGVVWYDADEQDAQDDGEHEDDEPDYCARCRYAGRCAGFCAVPPELF